MIVENKTGILRSIKELIIYVGVFYLFAFLYLNKQLKLEEGSMAYVSKLKDFMPLLAVIIAATLTYLLGFRKGKEERFNKQLEENLSSILSPMLHAIKHIERVEETLNREELLKNFFSKYSSQETKLYILSSKEILEWYFLTEDLFYDFLKIKTKDNWETFWVYFKRLSQLINEEYYSVRGIIYSDYRWLLGLNQKNYLIKIFIEFFCVGT